MNITEAEKILQQPDLFQIIIRETGKRIAGEHKARKCIFLIGCGIYVANYGKNKNNIIVEGNSSIGKSHTTYEVMKIFPRNRIEYRTRISLTALNYWHNSEDWTWDGKILYLEDINNAVLNSDVLKTMMSEGSIAEIADPKRKTTITLKVNGKPIVIVTIREPNPKAEILNRMDSIELVEEKSQCRQVRSSQAQENENGFCIEYGTNILDAMKLLKPVKVRIPFASKLVDKFPNVVESNRIFPRLLNLIKNSCALHQYQRKQDDKGYHLATSKDLELALEVNNHLHRNEAIGLSKTMMKRLGMIKEFSNKELKGDEIRGHFTVNEIYHFSPVITKKNWYQAINKLCEKGYLVAESDERDIYNKTTMYSLKSDAIEEIIMIGSNDNNYNNYDNDNNYNNDFLKNLEEKSGEVPEINVINVNNKKKNEKEIEISGVS